ncbi:O-antigen polymerase [uncultured Treponema sp.]|uniref:O-antigen polymerase n=1 Tax=uncultured Treponema sp. TaxID=162155 RepID=UPI0025D93105|nr:O-antigen polymerase [uncultured Treponema sp.]
MIWILLFLLIAFDILLFIFFDRNILSPSVLAVSMFVLSTFVACLNIETWKFHISSYTVVMIMTSLIALGAGEFVVRLFYYKRIQSKNNYIPLESIKLSNKMVLFISMVMSFLCFHYLNELMRLAIAAGYSKNAGLLFVAYVRIASLKPEVYGRIDRLAGWSCTFAEVFAYIFLYIVCFNKIFFNKFNLLYLLPIITYLPYTIFSGGRTEFIYIIAFIIVVGGTFYLQKNRWRGKSMFKILKAGILGIILFFCIFIAIGSLKNSIFIKKAFSTISFYTGMSIPSLDDYFLNPRPKGEYFGEHVLFGIYKFLKVFDNSIPQFYAPYDFVDFNGTKGNVYTVIRRYHQDFGLFGLYILMFFLGLFYGFFYLWVNKKQSFCLLVYGTIIAPIIEASIEERFFMSIISHSRIAVIMFLYFGFVFFTNKKFRQSFSIIFAPVKDKRQNISASETL